MSKRATKIVWALGGLLLLGLILLYNSGCAGARAPVHIAAPTAAMVQAKVGVPATAARTSNARASIIAAKAEKSGLAAGSADAHALTLATAETDRHLADVLAGKDALTAQLGSVQLQIDALEKDDATKTATVAKQAVEIKKVEHSRRLWIWLFLLSLVADFFAGHLVEQYLRGAVTFAWRWIAVGYHFAAGALKAFFPLYTFWLPA